jgi:ABC-2 type transport system permease protein
LADRNGNSRSPFHGLWALTNRELKKWYKNPYLLLMSIIQPLIWMGLFGRTMNIGAIISNNKIPIPSINPPLTDAQLFQLGQALSGLSTTIMKNTFGTADYFSYMSVGIISFVTLFTTMFSGMSIVWDRRLGVLNKLLSTPVARGSILMSKVLNAVIRSIIQSAIVLGFAVALGLTVGPDFTPINLLGVFAAVFLVGMGLSSIFIAIAVRSTKWETQMAVMNLLNLPLLFASNALFPSSIMPNWLQAFVKINPISYATDAARQLILYTVDVHQLAMDFLFLGVFAVIFSAIGILISWRYLSR